MHGGVLWRSSISCRGLKQRLRLQTKGYDPVFGARPVKRAVQRELETGLAKALLRGEFGEDDTGGPSLPPSTTHLLLVPSLSRAC